MSKNTWIIAGLVALIALAPLAEGARKKRKAIKKKAETEKRDKDLDKKERAQRDFERLKDIGMAIELPEKVKSLTDDMEKLDEQVTLTDQQKKKIPELRAIRDKTLERWDKVNKKKFTLLKARLEKLTTRREMKLCKTIVARVQSMSKTRASIVTVSERKFFSSLTLDQRAKWNAPILAEILLNQFSSLELTDEQTAKIETASKTQAKRCAFPLDPEASSKIVAPVTKYVYTRILTPRQKKAYILANRREKASKKSR